MGKICKHHLDDINKQIRLSSELFQWRNTAEVLKWFSGIRDKPHCKFIKFDIVDFYPSIPEELLKKTIKFAMKFDHIPSSTIKIIVHSRKSILFNEGNAWVKKTNPEFDVAIGSYNGAEICELVGLYLQDQLSAITGKHNTGLYRDDGLAILRGKF